MIHQLTLDNGLVVIVDEMPHVESVGYELRLPGGLVSDPADRVGASLVIAEMLGRGAGSLDSRALSDAFESIGARHAESATSDRFALSGALLSSNIDEALRLVAQIVLAPRMPADELDSARSLLLQDIASVKDNPMRTTIYELFERYFPKPWSRRPVGDEQGIKSVSRQELLDLHARSFRPEGAVLSIAGNVSAVRIVKTLERLFAEWRGASVSVPSPGNFPAPARYHVASDSAQVQITAAYPGATYSDPAMYAGLVCNSILSGGMFGRLFIEVREKRGLCYTVYSRYVAAKDYGITYAYAGTTPDRAQETFDVMTAELKRVFETITDEELARAKANIKATLIMGEESSSSRAASNAADWWFLGKVKSVEEIESAINHVTADDIYEYLERFPPANMTVLTLGSKEIRV